MARLMRDRSLAGFEEKAAEAATMLKALGNEKRLTWVDTLNRR